MNGVVKILQRDYVNNTVSSLLIIINKLTDNGHCLYQPYSTSTLEDTPFVSVYTTAICVKHI